LGGSIERRENWEAASRQEILGGKNLFQTLAQTGVSFRILGGSVTPTEKCACVGVFVRACACAGVMGAHKNQHRKVQANTQNWAAESRLGKIERQHRTSRKLGGSIIPRKIGRQELITNTRKNGCIIQKIGRQHYAHRKVCVCGRVCACVSVCVWGRMGRTQKSTQKGSGAHTTLGGSITPGENWAAASQVEKIGRQQHAKKNWAATINYKHSQKQLYHSEIGRQHYTHRKVGVRVRVRAYWAHKKPTQEG